MTKFILENGLGMRLLFTITLKPLRQGLTWEAGGNVHPSEELPVSECLVVMVTVKGLHPLMDFYQRGVGTRGTHFLALLPLVPWWEVCHCWNSWKFWNEKFDEWFSHFWLVCFTLNCATCKRMFDNMRWRRQPWRASHHWEPNLGSLTWATVL